MPFTAPAKEKIFRPPGNLIISLAAALIYSVYATFRFAGDKLLNQYYYVVPIVVPLTIFLLERAEKFRRAALRQRIIDFAVVLTALWRVIGDVPYVSGHTLFLTYCILTLARKIGRILAAIIMVEVLYLKFFVWHDWLSALLGIFSGIIAAIIYGRGKDHSNAAKNT